MAEKKNVYIRCPRCELNYCLKKEKICSVCKAEMERDKDTLVDELDLELCPICKTNYIRPDEIMCASCLKERAENADDINAQDDEWEEYINRDEDMNDFNSDDEETGDMASITDFDDKSWVAALPFDFPHLKIKSPLLLRLALISFCDLQARVLSNKDSFQNLRRSFFCRNKLHFETFKATGMIRRASLVAQRLGKKSICSAGDLGSIPGEGNGNPLQNSCWENSMDRGTWWTTVHGVTRSQTRLKLSA